MPLRPIPKPRVPRAGRPAGHFTQHRRLDKLRDTLEANPDGLGLEDLAMLLHVTTRSVRRYLHELTLLVDVESIETAPGGAHLWRIKPSERGRSVALRRTQAYGILGARRIFDVFKGSALYDELDVALREVMQIARRPTRGAVKGEVPSDQRLEERFLYIPCPARSYAQKADELDDLFQAVAELRVLRFRYRAEKTERVTAHPYAMLIHKGQILCIGLDVEREEVRAFAFERMLDPVPSQKEHFRVPHDFELADFFQGEFGIGPPAAKGAGHRVLIEFEARVADDVRARRVHPSQKVAVAPDGRARVSMTLASLEEVRAWVLGFGAAARVIEPPELAADIAGELRRALARY